MKRGSDLVGAAALLALFGVPMALIALLVRFDSRGPALFRQRRIGRGSAEFVIYKFRTMGVGTPEVASHLMVGRHASHVTRIGGFLRRSSLDELPQLFNIVRGEMTFVGPRPALFNQDDLIAMRRTAGVDALKPGVTGWAQINGRDDVPNHRKVELDRYYLERCGPALDVAILLRTPFALLVGRGVN
ncbi:MAG: sugar transferase [Candidatus Eisenbacteria bacterium]|uniref:Sugar transferase n=1 Tax=Eiseniibacteriota bacterium TaxID=2212470 RepID=A0A849SDH4_UNCEI|nr:sugar transferase [Candidatus Eisenbacteria bacterium]